PLKGLDHRFGGYVHLRWQAITESTQAIHKVRIEPVFARLRPKSDTRERELTPREQFARIQFARRGNVGMAEHTRGRNLSTLYNLAAQFDHRFGLDIWK